MPVASASVAAAAAVVALLAAESARRRQDRISLPNQNTGPSVLCVASPNFPDPSTYRAPVRHPQFSAIVVYQLP